MVLPTKEPNRLKPFKRINNDAFLVTEAPSDSPVDCGCHTRHDLPQDLDVGLRDYIKNNVGGLGPLLEVMDAVKVVTDGIAKALDAVDSVIKAVPILRVIVSPVLDVIRIFDKIVEVVNDVLHEFMIHIGEELTKRAVRLLPQWVPVRKSQLRDGIRSDQIVEVEGIVTRSYGDPVQAPFIQWHTWMNWSVQLKPEPQYEILVTADIAPDSGSKAAQGQGSPVAASGSFDVQWDVGAMNGKLDGSRYEHGFDDTEMPFQDGPMTEPEKFNTWLWPTMGMYVWASGRWVFDCNRVDDVDSASPKACAIMNPPRAVATATWGAVEFDENPLRPHSQLRCSVPAIQFMFFTCRRGGYVEYNDGVFADTDYEFIVDLPPLAQKLPPFPIDFSPNIDHNKIVLRPRLLQKVQGISPGDAIKIEPVVRLLPPDTLGAAPTQALVTIPAAAIGRSTQAAGFVLSMGWHDPLRVRAAEVKRCQIILRGVTSFIKRDNSAAEFQQRFGGVFDSLRRKIREKLEGVTILGYSINSIPTHQTKPRPNVPDFVLDAGDKIHQAVDDAIEGALKAVQNKIIEMMGGLQSDECLFRVSVNGHWRSVYFKNKNPTFQPFPGSALVLSFDLGPDDPLFIAMGGVEFNAVGDMMRNRSDDRVLKLKHIALTWSDICFAKNPDLTDMAFEYAVQTLLGNSKSKLALGSENTAMGLLEPNKAGPDPASSNPLNVRGLQPVETSVVLSADFAHAIAPEFGVYETPQLDYQLHYDLKIDDLIPKPRQT